MSRIDGLFKLAAKETLFGVRKWVKPESLEGLRYTPLATDCLKLKKNPLSEFKNYMAGIEREGKNFVPENPDSLAGQYSKSLQKGLLKLKPCIESYKNFILKNAEKLNVSKDEYYELVDEIAKKVQKEIRENPGNLRKEFVDNAGKIHKWAEIFAIQHFENGKNIYSKFYDEKMYNNAVKEYTEFVEKLTGKKVLIGCTSRMNWGIQALGAFNDPKAYQNMDYILISHGKNSSLITDTKNPLTWRFSDNDKSVYEFIEKNVPKGKKVMVLCCETDGIRKAGKTAEEMFDRTGNRMYGIGNEVWATWAHQNEAIKICESGVRHIIGHCESAGSGIIMSRIGDGAGPANNSLSYLDTPKQIYYDLDFSKFTV